MTNLLKNLLIALVVAALLFAGYFFYLKDEIGGTGDTPINRSQKTMRSAEEETQELLERLTVLNNIKIDDKIFEDERFRLLVDFRQDLGKEPIGRTNPFAPPRQ